MSEMLILVDESDNEIGREEKIKIHKEGKLHRAFSIFIFNSKGHVLLTKRAESKYHWGGFWSNTCCSHPRPGEGIEDAAHRRLKEEIGFDCDLREVFSFIYEAEFENGIGEHEFDHVFIGTFDGTPEANLQEMEDWRWVSPANIEKDISNSAKYTPWFQVAWKKLQERGII